MYKIPFKGAGKSLRIHTIVVELNISRRHRNIQATMKQFFRLTL